MPYWLDGNNLIGHSVEQAKLKPQVRREFLKLLSAWAAVRGGKFVVYFDGDDIDGQRAPKGVSIRYSAPLTCDQAIVRSLSHALIPKEVVVVTNDRSLGRLCREAGAKVMDWSEFAGRLSRRGMRQAPKDDKPEVELREWAEYFGLAEGELE